MAISKIKTNSIADNAITSTKIGVDVIVAEDIAANAITVAEISNGAVTTAKLDSAGIAPTITGGTITGATFAAGAVGTPSITTTGDTNTGIFFPAADTIAFSEGGVESMRINSSGNVGIGTSSPAYPLQVSTAAETNIAITGGTASETNIFFGDSGSATIGRITYNNNGDYMRFNVNASERMRIDSSGNVGIGTSSPAAKLDVRGSSSFLINATNPTAWVSVDSALTTGAMYNQWNTTSNVGITGTYTNHPHTFVTNNTERMRIDTSGNLQFNSGYGSVATAFGCRAWVNFNGTGTPAIRASGNVSSITDNGTGDYTINFTTAMPDANYVTVGTALSPSNGDAGKFCVQSTGNPASTNPTLYSTTQVRFVTGTTSPTVTNQDSTYVGVSIFR